MGRRRDRLPDKNVSITGSGARQTTILAPQTLVAASADTKAVFDGPRIKRTFGAPVRTFEWCGFTATATVQP
ncbi:hypothetical protein [Streptomyces mirabilis]|uniref:hypothetical protein n=1 Tax=Streptomyces mirabilis TaxID=68239 RepID=UPI00365B1CD2